MYQEIVNMNNQKVIDGIKRIADNAFIPFDPDNRDYVEYLEWVEAGNTPLPADEVSNG